MGIEPTSEPWGLLSVPTSLPRGQTNLRPSRPYLTITRERRTHFPLVCVGRCVSGEREGLARKYVAPLNSKIEAFFQPTIQPTICDVLCDLQVLWQSRGLVCCCKT
jgi:hypothetical protein